MHIRTQYIYFYVYVYRHMYIYAKVYVYEYAYAYVYVWSGDTYNPDGAFKGTVQRKLRGVQNGINRNVLLETCGAGHLFQIFFSLHPLISSKQLSATTAERIGVVY
jgi:hypothetical protein